MVKNTEAKRIQTLREVYENYKEEDVYEEDTLAEMLDSDQISTEEAGFMLGYHSA